MIFAVNCFTLQDGHDSEDSKQSTADMSAFVSATYSEPYIRN